MTITAILLTAALAGSLDADLKAVAALAGEPSIVAAAAVTRDEASILTIENADAFDPAPARRRLVIVGGLDGDQKSIDAAVAAVRWFKTRAPAAIRRQWSVSALPSAQFDPADKLSMTRWVTFQAPDLVITIGGTWDGVKGIPYRSSDGGMAELQKVFSTPIERSPLHDELIARVKREPLEIAKLLARRYPETPSISYIPATAWTETLHLARVIDDDTLRQKVRGQIQTWTSGEKKLFGDRIQLTSVAGTLIFADLAAAGDAAAARLADEALPLAAARKPTGIAEYGQGWTDDMFMAASVLARATTRPGDRSHDADLDAAARLLIDYTKRLQQPNGLFNHATDGPAAWGRGNGFAAFGLMETLTAMPAQHGSRAELIAIVRRHLSAVKTHQSADGSWRQIIDEPGAYREETATAMLMTAMARGMRMGWLDRSYLPAVNRAWRALAAHVAADGTLVDVCSGTGAGPTRRYYFDRPAVTGADDRGGAMALLAAMEMFELAKSAIR
jgi:hypothetical protein